MIDNHTHTLRPDAVVNLDPVSTLPRDLVLRPGYLYSVGVHPWNASCVSDLDLRVLRAMAASPRVVAIGETGLDTVHISYDWVWSGEEWTVDQTQPSLDLQEALLDYHVFLSEHLQKPLLLHIVKRFPEIIRLRNKLKPTQPWIIHGFRGKPGLAKDLLKFGFYLSYGEKFNPLSVAATPPSRLLIETDESRLPLPIIARSLGVKPKIDLARLCRSQ